MQQLQAVAEFQVDKKNCFFEKKKFCCLFFMHAHMKLLMVFFCIFLQYQYCVLTKPHFVLI